MPHTDRPTPRSRDVLLGAAAALLALHVLGAGPQGSGIGTPGPAPALAQQAPGDGLVSAADQRKQVISELRTLSQKLDRLDAKLTAGINVKVKEMPAQKPGEARADAAESK